MNTVKILVATVVAMLSLGACRNNPGEQAATLQNREAGLPVNSSDSTKVIYFAGGCFWGTEHFFKQVDGVLSTEAGFANGRTENPTYRDVIYRDTGFAETVKVTYDPDQVDLTLLLDLYFLTIDPTSVNKQGNDRGDQYRTGIYYTSTEQLPLINERVAVEASRQTKPIAVEVSTLKNYFKAEDYHQDYLENNPGGYCHINPDLFEVAKAANRKSNQQKK